MFNTFNRWTMIAVFAVLGLVTAAGAQNKPQVPGSATHAITRPGNGASSSGGIANNSPSPEWVIGWNYVHATNCTMYNYIGNTYLLLYPQEGGYFYTAYPDYQNVIEPACQTGNWLAFHIIDSANDWDQVYTFDYQ